MSRFKWVDGIIDRGSEILDSIVHPKQEEKPDSVQSQQPPAKTKNKRKEFVGHILTISKKGSGFFNQPAKADQPGVEPPAPKSPQSTNKPK